MLRYVEVVKKAHFLPMCSPTQYLQYFVVLGQKSIFQHRPMLGGGGCLFEIPFFDIFKNPKKSGFRPNLASTWPQLGFIFGVFL